MKELIKISNKDFFTPKSFYNMSFITVVCHLRRKQFMVLWSPIGPLQVGICGFSNWPPWKTPKSLLLQIHFSSLIRSIIKKSSNSVIYLHVFLIKTVWTDFSYWVPPSLEKSPKLDPRRIFLHRAIIFSMMRIRSILFHNYSHMSTPSSFKFYWYIFSKLSPTTQRVRFILA